MGDVFSNIRATPSDVNVWCKLFMLSHCILSSPKRGGRYHWQAVEMLVKCRIRRWREGDIIGPWNSVLDGAGQPSSNHAVRKKGTPESLRESNARRARQVMKDGLYRKAIQSLGSDGLAPLSVENQAVMLSKHPQAPPPPTSVQVTIEEVARALKSFPNGSAPGPSGLRANHLKEAAFCPSPDRADYAQRTLSGGGEPDVCRLSSSSCCTLPLWSHPPR